MADQSIAILLLVSTLLLLQIRKISHSPLILSVQSVVLALFAVLMWFRTGIGELLVAAGLTLVIKAIGIPYILHYTIRRVGIKREAERVLGKHTSLLIGLALSLAAYFITWQLELPGTAVGKPYLPVALALIFLGVFLMIDHKKAIMQGVGLITIENGLFLIAQAVSYGMPLLVELGIFFDLLVSVIVIGILSYRIQSTFESLNTEHMQNLKG